MKQSLYRESSEQWATIPAWPMYLISDQGKIWSIRARRLIATRVGFNGYRNADLWDGPRHRKGIVARWVLMAFSPCSKQDSLDAAHCDGIRTNDSLSNLRWATRRDNQHDRKRHGTAPSGEKNGRATINSFMARVIKRCLERQMAQPSIAKIFHINRHVVTRINCNKSWSAA